MNQGRVIGDMLQYVTGNDSTTFVQMVEEQMFRGWTVKTIDRTNDGKFYAFLEFPR
jgi:hypothetical protein